MYVLLNISNSLFSVYHITCTQNFLLTLPQFTWTHNANSSNSSPQIYAPKMAPCLLSSFCLVITGSRREQEFLTSLSSTYTSPGLTTLPVQFLSPDSRFEDCSTFPFLILTGYHWESTGTRISDYLFNLPLHLDSQRHLPNHSLHL